MITLKNFSELTAGDTLHIYEFFADKVVRRDVGVISVDRPNERGLCLIKWKEKGSSKNSSYFFPRDRRAEINVNEVYSTDPTLAPYFQLAIMKGVKYQQESVRKVLGL